MIKGILIGFALAVIAIVAGTARATMLSNQTGAGYERIGVKACVTVSLSTTSAATSANAILRGTKYRVISDINVFIRTDAAATSAAGNYLPGNVPEVMTFAGQSASANPVVHAIVSVGTGTLYLCPIDEVR